MDQVYLHVTACLLCFVAVCRRCGDAILQRVALETIAFSMNATQIKKMREAFLRMDKVPCAAGGQRNSDWIAYTSTGAAVPALTTTPRTPVGCARIVAPWLPPPPSSGPHWLREHTRVHRRANPGGAVCRGGRRDLQARRPRQDQPPVVRDPPPPHPHPPSHTHPFVMLAHLPHPRAMIRIKVLACNERLRSLAHRRLIVGHP
jgi:hypothetical protein